MNNISEFIQRKLSVLNASKSISVPKQDDYISRVRDAITKSNNLLDTVSIEVNGVALSKEQVGKVKIGMPDAFKAKPTIYESYGSDGFIFVVEVS